MKKLLLLVLSSVAVGFAVQAWYPFKTKKVASSTFIPYMSSVGYVSPKSATVSGSVYPMYKGTAYQTPISTTGYPVADYHTPMGTTGYQRKVYRFTPSSELGKLPTIYE